MFSKAATYALRAVLYLADHSSGEKRMGVMAIAEALEVPKHYLAKILQELARHGLISSVKGPAGGFFLTEENRKVTLMEVLHCIDGDQTLSACILGLPVCSSRQPCPLHFQVVGYRDGLKYQLSNWTISELEGSIINHHFALGASEQSALNKPSAAGHRRAAKGSAHKGEAEAEKKAKEALIKRAKE